jgi:hypothetical protein
MAAGTQAGVTVTVAVVVCTLPHAFVTAAQ